MPSVRMRGACLAAVGALLVVGCGGGSGSSTAGQASSTTTTSANAVEHVDWPLFGRVPERTQWFPDAPDPPFHFLWQFFAHQLIEFPPVLQDGNLYVVNKVGGVYAVRGRDGKVIWKRSLDPDVTGPAFDDGLLFLAQFDGDFVALDARTGKERWSFRPRSHLESSPLIADGGVYVGDDAGTLAGVDAETGELRWRAQLSPDAIKASPSFHDGVVYVGDYAGVVHAVSAGSGHEVWSRDTADLPPGGSAGFYASPTIAFGHIYEARVDGAVYAFDLNGKPAWHFQAGKGVYGSVAASNVEGIGPTVFVGSYDHKLYALDAQDGHVRWTYDVGGQIPGSPTVIGSTVYTSSFQTKKTIGLDTRTGKPVFKWGSAGYEPMSTDGDRNYLAGFQTIWAFEAKHPGGDGSASNTG
jgi:outer membrane protein assembly factor BamB